MLRSFLLLLLLASLPIGPMAVSQPVPVFDPTSVIALSPVPQKIASAVAPDIQAKSALVMDLGTGTILYGKNIHEELPMASLTKIMTAMVILQHHSLDEVVKVKDNFNNLGSVRMWLKPNEKITVENLLMGLLIPSAGDAAVALAEYHSGTVEKFVEEMNQKARELRLTETQFKNPVGLDEEGQFSSVYDLAILTKYALRNPVFRQIVQMKEAEVSSVGGAITHGLKSTDLLLNSYLDIRGVKTGTTDEAGQSLINLAYNAEGRAIIAVLLNSSDRFQENKGLIDWTFRSYVW